MSESAARKKSILVVEDHPDTSRMLSRLLRGHGYDVSTAATLASAKSLCENQRFDLAIADISLPDGSGTELMSQIQSVCPGRGILMSGHDQEFARQLGDKQRWDDYLVKPVDFAKLLAAVRRLLEAPSRLVIPFAP